MKRQFAIACVSLLAMAALAENNVSLPQGTPLKVKLDNTITTTTNRSGDPFTARVISPVTVDGKTVIPVGTTVQGRLTRVTEPRRVAGKPTIGMFPETLILPSGEHYLLNATLVDTSVRNGTDVNDEGQFKGKGYDKTDMIEIGAGTGGGMLVGGLIGGGKGVLIGGVVGAGATVGHWLGKRNSAMLPAGTRLNMELSRPLVMSPATGGQ